MDSSTWCSFDHPPPNDFVANFSPTVELPMRSLFLCCALVAPLSGLSYAQTTSDIVPVDQRNHDFGDVTKSSKSEHKVTIRNPYKSDMRINGVRASCGCTTPILESQVVRPGESTSLIAHFNTDRFTGDKKATLTVSIASPIFTELQLNVKGYIRSDVVVSPGEAAFGSIPETTDKKLTLNIDYAGRSDWKILDIVSPFGFVKANATEVSRGNGRVRYTIDVAVDGSAPEGFIENQLIIQTNDQRRKTFPIAFSASIDKPLKASPPSLALGTIKPNEPIQQRLTLTAKSDFKILEISSPNAEVRCDLPESPKRVHMLNLVITPKPGEGFNGEIKGKILLQTDAKTDKPLEIPLSFTFETEKLATVNPAPL